MTGEDVLRAILAIAIVNLEGCQTEEYGNSGNSLLSMNDRLRLNVRKL